MKLLWGRKDDGVSSHIMQKQWQYHPHLTHMHPDQNLMLHPFLKISDTSSLPSWSHFQNPFSIIIKISPWCSFIYTIKSSCSARAQHPNTKTPPSPLSFFWHSSNNQLLSCRFSLCRLLGRGSLWTFQNHMHVSCSFSLGFVHTVSQSTTNFPSTCRKKRMTDF